MPNQTIIRSITYSSKGLEETTLSSAKECLAAAKRPVAWINFDGLSDAKLMAEIADAFGLHPLVLEDITHTKQRPKVEDYDDYLYIVLRMLSYDDKTGSIGSEQVSIILGKRFVLSFQEKPGDIFDKVREQLRRDKGKLRRKGPDFLTYALVDVVVDNYFIILERLGEKIESMESEVVADPSPKSLQRIRKLKRSMLALRKSVWPLRELLLALERESANKDALITEETAVYLRDVYDHTIQVIDTTETFRDVASGMVDIYLSSMSNRLNEIMKVLTIIGTIFIPITFVTGLYGMNFEHMPELEHPLGYPAALLLMLVMSLIMLLYFRKKKWI